MAVAACNVIYTQIIQYLIPPAPLPPSQAHVVNDVDQCCVVAHRHPSETTNGAVDLKIWTSHSSARNATAPLLSGIFFEDISCSGDGGIYGELLRNRAFQGSGVTLGMAAPNAPGKIITSAENPTLPFGPVLDGWYAIGQGVNLSLDLLHPLSDALQVALQVDIPLDATGEVGIKNDGWWGIPVLPQKYTASFYAQTDGFRWNWTITHFDVSLRDNFTGEIFVSSRIAAGGPDGPVPYQYMNYSTQLVNERNAPTEKNAFAITMDASEVAGQTLYFDLVSLFGETYKGRENGLRKDLAEQLEAANFKFLRFPGGNNLEGYSIARRWKWWQTIGPLANRPGRPGDWTYFNTDGLGLLDYMYWCEDMDLVPLLAIFAGFSLDQANFDMANSTDSNELPLALMQPVLQEALDELEYLMGNESTFWGAQRALHGHPEPFDVPFVEIGNEDFFSHDYPARADFLFKGLQARYPNITYIYSAPNAFSSESNATLPPGTIWDKHIYDSADHYIDSFDEFDNWQEKTNNPGAFASAMEYHVGGYSHPSMISAVAEAVWALGWERNPNVFKLSAFAPVIQNMNSWRHTPYLLLFGADPSDTLISTSYYQQQMFNLYKGTHTLPVTIESGDYNPLFWVASIDEPKNLIYFKIVNSGNATQTLVLTLDVAFISVNGTILAPPTAGDPSASNSFENRTAVVPKTIEDLQNRGTEDDTTGTKVKNALTWTVPSYSIAALQFNLVTSHDE